MATASFAVQGAPACGALLIGCTSNVQRLLFRKITPGTTCPSGRCLGSPTGKHSILPIVHNHDWERRPTVIGLKILASPSGCAWRNYRRHLLRLLKHGERYCHGSTIRMARDRHSFLIDAPFWGNRPWSRSKFLDGRNTEQAMIGIPTTNSAPVAAVVSLVVRSDARPL